MRRNGGRRMDVTRHIQVVVAWVDLILCRTAQVLAVALLTVLMLALVWCARTYFEKQHDPYLIDYDAPGVDITSEGPDDGDPWFTNGGDDL